MVAAWWGPLNEPCCSLHAREGRRGDDSGGHGRGASEPHGTDGWTPMADCSPISRISRTSTLNRLGGMATSRGGGGGGGGGSRFRNPLSFIPSIVRVCPPRPSFLRLLRFRPRKITSTVRHQLPRFVYKNKTGNPANYFASLRV